MQLQGKQVTVFGVNRSGVAAAKLLSASGATVTVTDTRDADALSREIADLDDRHTSDQTDSPYRKFLGGHPPECIADADFIVVSPGVPLEIPILGDARARNLPILAELEVAASISPAPIVAITGTKGKSTTTLLTAAILKATNRFSNVCVAGNIGVPLAAEVRNLTDRDIAVVEASSFQLESTVNFQPKVSVVLNLSRDHLDRHKTMAAYQAAKQKITHNQTPDDWMILNGSDPAISDFAVSTRAKVVYFNDTQAPENSTFASVFRDGTELFALWDGIRKTVCEVADIRLRGAHNVQNVLAAIAVGLIFGATECQIQQALQTFDPSHPALSHAFEPVRTLTGVEFIDDSKATNVAAVKAALESIENAKIILIMGGYDKGNDYTPLRQLVQNRVKTAVMLGEYTQQIEKAFVDTTHIVNAKTMAEAVHLAYKNAGPGDIVLLSPANASFDMYTDYKARGADFKAAVNVLQPLHEKIRNKPTR